MSLISFSLAALLCCFAIFLSLKFAAAGDEEGFKSGDTVVQAQTLHEKIKMLQQQQKLGVLGAQKPKKVSKREMIKKKWTKTMKQREKQSRDNAGEEYH